LYQYNAQTESFSLVKGTRNGDIRDIKVDAQGNLWFIKGLLLSKYNLSTHKIESYSNADFSVTSLCISDGTVWFVTTNGLIWQYHPAQNTFTNNDLFNHSKPAISHWIEKIYATENHQIFIGTSNQGVKLFNTQNKSYEDILNNNPDGTEIYARDFIHYAKDEYWIATESGLFVFNLKTRAFTNLRKQYYNPYSISDNATYTLCKDKEGGIWIGTYFGGVNYFPKQNTAFEKYFYNGSVNSIAGNAIREICSDQLGNLWIGTEDAGLNKRSSKGIFTHFNPTSQNKISHSNIHGLLAVGNELWVGTFEQGLDVLNINTGKLIRHYKVEANPNSLRSNFIETFFKTKSNEVLVGASVGLYRYNPQSDNFTLFSKMPAQYHYNTVLEDADGTIWAGTLRDGVYFYNPKTQKSGFYKHQDEHKNSLSNNAINGLFTDSQRNLWICTENGLCKFNPKEQNFTRFGPKNGFPSNVFYKILEDKNQNLWISTSKGLACFNLKTKKISTYAKANGLLSDQFNYNSAYQDAKGKMYFGSVNGLISFVPENFTKNNAMPSVYITGFQVHNEELPINPKNSPLSKSITLTNKITLSHNQSTFSIDFGFYSTRNDGIYL
jgi:ligand-binding sensor domain-containing protein